MTDYYSTEIEEVIGQLEYLGVRLFDSRRRSYSIRLRKLTSSVE